MRRRDFLKVLGGGAVAWCVPGSAKVEDPFAFARLAEKPNVIILLADDLGYGDVGCYGNKIINTPNIDALAKGGVRFTDFHSNGPMCTPTRAALLTGRYQQRSGLESVLGVRGNADTGMSPKEVTFAEVLGPAGYATGMFGKWHLGYSVPYNPVTQGFDSFRGFLAGGLDYHSHVNRSGHADWWHDNELKPEEGYTTELLTKYSVKFIDQNKDKPFCLYVPYQAVHFPFQGPKDKADRKVGGDYWSKAKYGSRYEPVADRKAAYKEMVESLDASVGRIVGMVRKLGLEKKTLIFFTSDNGGYSWVGSNKPCSGQKGSLLEGGHRVPAIAYWPGKIKAGTVTDATAMTMDLYLTMAHMAMARIPKGLKMDGTTLLPLMQHGQKLPKRSLFWRKGKAWAVRKGPWKLLKTKGNLQLYNLSEDIGETTDLSAKKPELVKAMHLEFLAGRRTLPKA